MVLGDITRRDWLLLLALACAGPIWYGGVLILAGIAALMVAGWTGVEGHAFTGVLLTVVGALASILAAFILMLPIVRHARNPRVLAAAVAAIIPLVMAVALWLEFDASARALLQLLGIESLAFAGTCLLMAAPHRDLGYR